MPRPAIPASYSILIAGKPLQKSFEVIQVQISRSINKIPSAEVFVVDKRSKGNAVPLSESAIFLPGNKIKIRAARKGVRQSAIFKGIIVKHRLKVDSNGKTVLTVSCFDEAIKLTVGRKNASYREMKDSDVTRRMLDDAGLTASVHDTGIVHREIIQYYSTDWDFIVKRAETNGLFVTVEDGKVGARKPNLDGRVALAATYGKDMALVEAEIDASTQFPAVTSSSWSPDKHKVVRANAVEPKVNKQGNLSGKQLAKMLGLKSYDLHTSAAVSDDGLAKWANAQMLKSRLGRAKGTIVIPGNTKAKPGSLLLLRGLGARFDGNAYISGIQHNLGSAQWQTTIQFGLPSHIESEIDTPPASGLLPAISGLHIGKVTDTNDPDGEARVEVNIPTLGTDGGEVWARLSNFFASNEVGAYFVPEVGDEVVLGFLNNDPRHPIVLGSLFSQIHQPPYGASNGAETIRGVVSKSQMKLTFDEANKELLIETKDGNAITLSDDQHAVTIADTNNNKIEMSADGILIESAADLSIKSKGALNLEADGAVNVKSKLDVNVEGLNVTNKANVNVTAQGGGKAELKSSGNVVIQGAMVNIN
ncbi:MAG: type VI secretion system tip protein VgrG [bacterium]